jgi:putative hydrolase of the HAD superfamily
VPRPNPDIDGVIFDFAGVLSTSPGVAMSSALDGFDIDLRTFMQIIMGPFDDEGTHPWHRLECGFITMDDYEAELEPVWRAAGYESFPTPPRGGMIGDVLVPITEMIDAAAAARAAGYRTAILTNNVKEWGTWRTMWDADNLVDVVIDSCEVGLRKPTAEIYELTLARLGTEAARTLFLDDFPWNIAGAETVGLQTMHVTDPVAAAASLRARLAV